MERKYEFSGKEINIRITKNGNGLFDVEMGASDGAEAGLAMISEAEVNALDIAEIFRCLYEY